MKLAARHKPYWRLIDRGCHIGYRKGVRGGIWRARYYIGEGQYEESVLGVADDIRDCDGSEVFDFSQAQQAAHDWFRRKSREKVGLPITAQGYTVAQVMADYTAWFKAHRKSLSALESATNTHILPALGHVEVSKLTPRMIREFHESMASAPARLRSGKGREARFRATPQSRDEIRARKSTANRVLAILKAALNRAYLDGQIESDEQWKRVKNFRGTSAAKVTFLDRDQCSRLVAACPEDLGRLVKAALLTGCRYGELVQMTAGDFNPQSGTLRVGISKSGRGRHVVLTEDGVAFFDNLAAGKQHKELLLTRADGKAWGASHQFRPLREACAAAGISPPFSFHALRHVYASNLAVNGADLNVIARQLGHADTRMVESHYAHLTPNHIAQAIRKAGAPIGLG
ncbi:MAG: site-specific integrase [Alphaproteobacteria bacterium]|nr:site-specific integrase [Alphaproteobacteria bacterium]